MSDSDVLKLLVESGSLMKFHRAYRKLAACDMSVVEIARMLDEIWVEEMYEVLGDDWIVRRDERGTIIVHKGAVSYMDGI